MFNNLKQIMFPILFASTERMMRVREKCIGGGKLSMLMYKFVYRRYCRLFCCSIPPSIKIGEGVTFPHGAYGIFVSQGAVIGDNCVIFHHVTIGSNTLKDSKGYGAPTIGNNVYIGTGAKIIGNVTVGDNVRIGANAVVVKDVPANATVVTQDSVIICHKIIRDNTFVAYEVNDKFVKKQI